MLNIADVQLPNVIGFDFYDGVTEGISKKTNEQGSFYFKVIAWDKSQDKRLFFKTSIEDSEYEKIKTFLSKVQTVSNKNVWLPEWKFANGLDKIEVSMLLNGFQRKLESSYLCFDINKKEGGTHVDTDDLIDRVKIALSNDDAGNLEEWADLK